MVHERVSRHQSGVPKGGMPHAAGDASRFARARIAQTLRPISIAPVHIARQMGDVKLAEADAAPIELKQLPIPQFEFTGSEQELGTEQTGGYVDLRYYPTNGMLFCTFRLRWDFSATEMSPEERAKFKLQVTENVRRKWSGRFPLIEYAGEGKTAHPSGRKASVHISFSEPELPTFKSGKEQVDWLNSQPDQVRKNRASMTRMNVLPKLEREHVVDGLSVELTPSSIYWREHEMKRYESGRGEYTHYREAGLKLSLGKSKSYWQDVTQHEFGHVFGLADEYIMKQEDYTDAVERLGEKGARDLLKRRRKASSGIMNVGPDIRVDHYRPFAVWLSKLTNTTWRVEGD